MLLPAASQREKVETEKTVSQRARTLIMHVLKCCNSMAKTSLKCVM
jgi:hypothetical protein